MSFNDRPKWVRFMLTFQLPTWKWDGDVKADQDARIKSGYTSLRITKATLQHLQHLRAHIAESQRAAGGYYGTLSMDDLLFRLADGSLTKAAPAAAAAAAKKKTGRKVRP